LLWRNALFDNGRHAPLIPGAAFAAASSGAFKTTGLEAVRADKPGPEIRHFVALFQEGQVVAEPIVGIGFQRLG
jgi:hypothetical protein